MISWEPWRGQVNDATWSLDAIARGDHDAYIRDWAADVAAWGHPILVRPMHEMNGGWTSWGVISNGNTPADFIDAWRHIVSTARDAGAGNIRWVWCPNTLLNNGVTYSSIYPGDAYVDWLCLDGYNWGTTQSWSSWESMRLVFERSVNALAALSSRPIMIGETGSSELGGDKARWILNGFAMLPTVLPRVEAVVWFNKAQDGADWPIDTSIASRDAYRTVSGWDAYQGRVR
jgi:beta-mannanase